MISILIPLFLISSIVEVVKTQKFLDRNKNNIKLSKEIEYKKSKDYFEKMIYFLSFIAVGTMTFYALYIGLFLKDTQALLAFIPLIICGTIGYISRIFVKPAKISSGSKFMIFLGSIAVVITIMYIFDAYKVDETIKKYNTLDAEDFRVLTSDTFGDKEKIIDDYSSKLTKNSSVLVPQSYEYHYYTEEYGFISTEYSHALNEKLAKALVEGYIKQGRNQLEQYTWNLGFLLQEDDFYAVEEYYDAVDEDYHKLLEGNGLNLEDFNSLDKTDLDKAEKKGLEIMKSKAISRDEENRWNLEEVYFLSYDKTAIVIREGKEVFYLEGKDFSDPEIIEIVKDRSNS